MIRATHASVKRNGPAQVVIRITAALVGGFVFTYGFVALGILASFNAGLRFFEAQSLAWMLSFLVYLGAIIWGFAARNPARVWLVLGGGGLAMSAAAWGLSRAML